MTYLVACIEYEYASKINHECIIESTEEALQKEISKKLDSIYKNSCKNLKVYIGSFDKEYEANRIWRLDELKRDAEGKKEISVEV